MWLAPPDGATADELAVAGAGVGSAPGGRGILYRHPQYPGDTDVLRAALERLDGSLDLAEPFGRIREAIGEARRMGVTNRN